MQKSGKKRFMEESMGTVSGRYQAESGFEPIIEAQWNLSAMVSF